jgi:hypothetical protein
MTDPGTALWFFVVVGGAIVLGVAMAYGFIHNRNRTAAERRATEEGTHRIYEKEERGA